MPREKIKFALRMSPETQRLVKEMYPRDNCRTQNEFIEKAIRFYSGCVSGQDACEFLPAALTDALRSTVHDSETRSRAGFRRYGTSSRSRTRGKARSPPSPSPGSAP